MSDPSTWSGLPDVKIDNAAADALATGCENAAELIRNQISGRKTLTTTALQDFEGRFSEIFTQNQDTANTDGEEIATALEDVAKAVRYIVSVVPAENSRRRDARAWAERRKEDKSKITFGDIGGDEDPPEGPTSPPPPEAQSATAKPREDPQPGSGGTSSGTTSARPQELRNFASGVKGKITELDGKDTKLSGLNTDFTTGFDWGTGEPSGVDGSAVYSALGSYNQLNEQDKTWVNTVADAFERAGNGEDGGVLTLSNASIANSLKAAGLKTSRYDIPATSPRLYGLKPTTGYSDDPVNASTGNFVEPETDLGFAGGCASLQLSRMYNSFNNGAGAFGAGWSSWTEVALVFDDESATLTLPDGRAVLFPRLGDAWDRATGESMWLERDDAADELRATDNDGGTWRFTRSGTPLSHDRGEGTMVSFVHEDGRLVRLEHERGRHIVLTWDGERVVSAETSDGRTITYAYDEGLRLTAATGPLGTRSYRWNDAGLVDAVIDADGVVEVENTYDEQGRVTGQLSPHGRTSRYSYLPGNVTEVADPDGSRSNTWIHDNRGQLIGIVDSDGNRQSTSYDQHGNPVVVTERDGSVTVREFDERGHMTREVRPSGADMEFEYDDLDRVVSVTTEANAVTRLSYDGASRNPSRLVDPEGGETRMEWVGGLLIRKVDPTGVEILLGYNEHGDLVTTTNAVGDTSHVEYDATGRVVAVVTPSGNRTTFGYGPTGLAERRDPDGSIWRYEHTAAARLAAIVDPTGARTTIEYGPDGDESRRIDPLGRAVQKRLDDLGNLAALELPDGSIWRFTHDALSRLTETTTPDGQTWKRTYDQVGELVGTVDPTGAATAVRTDRASGTVVSEDVHGSVTQRFDALGRPVSTERQDGSVAVATYDRCGREVELLDPEGALTRIERDAAGRPVAVISPTGAVTRYEYDACGRRNCVVDPDGHRTTIGYNADGLPVRVTLPTGESAWTRYDACARVIARFTPGVGMSRYTYDAAGRVVEVRDSVSGLRRFTYDAAGQVVKATNGNGGVTRYERDVRGRVVSITDPLGNVTRREFDAMDRCVAETDPLGRTTRAGYDAAGRQAWQEDARGSRTEWSYDPAGEVGSVRVDGHPVADIERDHRHRHIKLTDRTRPDGRAVIHESEWNRRGQVVRRSRDGEALAWSYDPAGRRTAMTLPDGQSVSYSYDEASNLVAVDHPLLGRATFEHDASGRVTAATAGGLIQSWEYAEGFVVAHAVTDDRGVTRTVVVRDDEGRIRGIEHDGTTTSYDYDAACQIVEARVGSDRVRWRYDTAGRIITESTESGTTREFAYDEGSQLLSVAEPEGTTRHRYDERGRRVRTEYADGRTRDLEWSATGWLAAIVDEAGSEIVRTHLHVDATAQLASINDTPVYWDGANGYAPPLAQVGATAVVPAGPVTGIGAEWTAPGWRTSRAQGNDVWSLADSGALTIPGLPEGIRVSPGGELTIGDLEWLGARVYDAVSRGFLSTDPLDPVTGAGWSGNPYSYAGNDPLHALDPTGLKPVSEADLEAANKEWYEKAWDATKQWAKDNTDYIVGGLIVAAGVGACFIPGVGPVLGPALISAGADVVMQRMAAGKDGQINWKQVAVSGAAGAVGGGSGALIKTVGITGARKVATTIGVETVSGAAQGVANYAVTAENFSWKNAGTEALKGGAGGLIGGGTAAKFEPLSDAAGTAAAKRMGAVMPEVGDDALKLTAEQTLAKHAAEMGVGVASNAESQMLQQALVDQELDPEKYGKDLLKSTVTDGVSRVAPGARTVEAPTS